MELYKRGSRGAVVRQIQKALHLMDDGIYGQLTEEAVRVFQSEHGLTPDGIVGAKTMALLIPCRFKKSKRKIDKIIVHCSDTEEGIDFTAEDIRLWHMLPPPRGNGWLDIGYHYVIKLDGTIQKGRDVDIIGSHCKGWNAHSIGVCYIGGRGKDGKTKDTRTKNQEAALLCLLMDLKKLYPEAEILGHRNLSSKECPCFDARTEYRNL